MQPTIKYAVLNGSRRRYQVAELLHGAGLLAGTFIDGCGSVGWPRLLSMLPQRILPSSIRRFVARRPALPLEMVWSNANLGIQYAWKLRRARNYTESIQVYAWFTEEFNNWIVKQDWGETGGIFVFDAASAALIDKAKRLGVRYIHEQTIAAGEVVQQFVETEARDFPGWECPEALPASLSAYCQQAYKASWEAADVIVCASEFVVDSLRTAGGPAHKCVVIPYGPGSGYQVPPRQPHAGPLRVLTVGTVGLRKGSQYVLAAARRMVGQVEFRMVGPIGVSASAAAELKSVIDLTGPVGHAEVVNHLAWADVFLLPSICEGSAVAVYEAITSGLPVITTANAGSIIRHGQDGIIVPIRNVDAIVDSLTELAANPAKRTQLAEAARCRAAEYTGERYARHLVEMVRGLDNPSGCP
jgi:glycosyltransferase involved in cell wall biosynthesis